jgi:DNA-binding winged helix-turn-helix (wHTH) protein/tetratricopeptide (TPR) repeat protein
LTKEDRPVRIQQRPLDVLIYLAENRARLVTRDELLERFWPPAINEEALTRCVSTLRKHLGDVRDPPCYVETLWGQGYRFIETVVEMPSYREESPSSSPDEAVEPAELQRGERVGVELGRASRMWRSVAVVGLFLVLVAAYLTWRSRQETASLEINRIAVIPIAAPDDEEWIGSALTDQLNLTVSRIEGITVVARGSASQFSPASDPIEIGERLNVDAVLISELDRSEGTARLQSELVSTRDGGVLWSFRLEPAEGRTELEQIRNLARAMAGRLWANLQLRDSEQQIDPAAYRLYLRGRYYWNQRSNTGLEAAIEFFESALQLQPDYVDALIGLADSWLLMPLYGAIAPEEAIPKARTAAETALRLDPSASHAHAVIGVINMQFDWDWLAAESHLRKAVTLNPNDATAEQWLGELYCYRRRFEECRRQLDIASGLDPLSPVLLMMRASPDLYSGQFEAAAEGYIRALEEMPGFTFSHFPLGHAYVGMNEWDDAISSYEASLPDLGLAIVGGPLIFARAKWGDTKHAESLLTELEALEGDRYVPPSKLAIAHLGLGQRGQSISWLWKAVEAHDDRLVYLAVDSVFQDLHPDPEFQRIVATVGLLDVLDQR